MTKANEKIQKLIQNGWLTADQLQRLTRLSEVLHEACPMSLEAWVGDFIGEARIENEIQIVEAVAVVYVRVSNNVEQTSEEEQ